MAMRKGNVKSFCMEDKKASSRDWSVASDPYGQMLC